MSHTKCIHLGCTTKYSNLSLSLSMQSAHILLRSQQSSVSLNIAKHRHFSLFRHSVSFNSNIYLFVSSFVYCAAFFLLLKFRRSILVDLRHIIIGLGHEKKHIRAMPVRPMFMGAFLFFFLESIVIPFGSQSFELVGHSL